MSSSLPTSPPKEDGQYITTISLGAAGISPRTPQHIEQPASSLPQNSKHKAVTGESNPEQALLTEKNLNKLNKSQPTLPIASSSTSSTFVPPGHEEWVTNKLRRQHVSPLPHTRTPSPSSPLNVAVTRGSEKPRSAKTIQTTHEPHQCALGIKCLLEIVDLNYHKTMATHLVAMAKHLRLPVRSLNLGRDYDDLASLRSRSNYATELLLNNHQRIPVWGPRGPHPMEVLKKIQSPEFWEAERKYLESPGCLAERQKATGILPSAPSIQVSDQEPSHPESATEERLWFIKHGNVIAPSRRTRSRTQLSTSLSSSVTTTSHNHPKNGECPQARQRLIGRKISATSRNISQEQGGVRLEKRKLEDAPDNTATKRQKPSEQCWLILEAPKLNGLR